MLHHHMKKHEAEKQEVLHQQCRYISRHAREIKSTLCPTDEVVHGFKVFGDNTQIYTTYILAILEWAKNLSPLWRERSGPGSLQLAHLVYWGLQGTEDQC